MLESASRHQPQRPLHLAPDAIADLPAATAASLSSTARLPFTVTVIDVPPTPDRDAALRSLHNAATAAGREILWCSPTREQANAAVGDQLADAGASITEAHTRINNSQLLPPSSLLIIDDAASASPVHRHARPGLAVSAVHRPPAFRHRPLYGACP